MDASLDGLEAITKAYAEAVLYKDPQRLAALYADDAVVFDTWENWSYEGREAWGLSLAAWLGSLGEERVEVRFEDVRSIALGDAGFLHATVTYAALDPAGQILRSMQNRLSWVLRKSDGDWRIAHEHTSVPIQMDDLKAILRRP